MLEPLIPSKDQETAITQMVNEPTKAALLAPETGVGKTLIGVEVVKRLEAQTVLLIGPVTQKVINNWKQTFTRQGVTLPFHLINSDNTENFTRLAHKEPGIYYVGREFFGLSATDKKATKKSPGSRKARWSWSKVHPEVAIFDEVQTASNRNSTTYEVLRTLKADYKIASSATPNGNKFEGLWSVCRWLWPKAQKPNVPADAMPHEKLYVDNSFWRWEATWGTVEVEEIYVAGKPRTIRKLLGEKEPGKFVDSLPCYIRIEADRKPYELRKVFVDLTPTQRRIYDDLENQALAWLDDHPLVADIPIVKRIRLRQVTLGEPTMVDTGEVTDIGEPIFAVEFDPQCESSKIDAVFKIIDKHEVGKQIVFWTDSQKFARVVTYRLNQRYGPYAKEWSGAVTQKVRQTIFDDFVAGTVRYIVAVIPALAEGVDGLQHVCHTEVWLNESSNEMQNTQAQGRLNRQGQPASKIRQYKLLAENTADDDHFNRLVSQRIDRRKELRGRS